MSVKQTVTLDLDVFDEDDRESMSFDSCGDIKTKATIVSLDAITDILNQVRQIYVHYDSKGAPRDVTITDLFDILEEHDLDVSTDTMCRF